jgi:ribosome-binding protein aMBF1 (putative translation factor)
MITNDDYGYEDFCPICNRNTNTSDIVDVDSAGRRVTHIDICDECEHIYGPANRRPIYGWNNKIKRRIGKNAIGKLE